MSTRYECSEAMLERALRTIPLGTQTFSKSKTQYPAGVSPFFAHRAKGSRLWDVDGNEYIDLVNSLAAITLGYGDPDVDAAVRAQLEDGVIFSLPHPVEIDVAERIVDVVPCAEKVRFGKNGSDATAGAVRLARAFTGRDRVAACGYHGWQDWYIGATARDLGVPSATSDLTHFFTYGDPDSLANLLRSHRDEFACVIMEPMNLTFPPDGYLDAVRALTHQAGALLVFDETVTGFRLALGGAQELLGVTPDLATFGKGLANGYPLSAVAGRADVMALMEEVFFSFTFGGEALSLAAASATIDKLRREPVLDGIARIGGRLMRGVQGLIDKHGLAEHLSTSGHPAWHFIVFADSERCPVWDLKTLFLQEVFARGVLTLGTHNLSYAFSDADADRVVQVYDEVFGAMTAAISADAVAESLKCEPLVPLFKIR